MFELVFDNLKKPINMGVIIRLACATGSRLYFTGDSINYDNRKARLAAVGYEESADITYLRDFQKLIKNFKNEGKTVIGTSPTAKKVYSEIDYTKPVVLVFGNEASGLSQINVSMMDELVTIPMPGNVESLNVTSSAAIILYEGLRQRGFRI